LQYGKKVPFYTIIRVDFDIDRVYYQNILDLLDRGTAWQL